MKALICLEKNQDWLEAYSIFANYPQIVKALIIYKANSRNNRQSVLSLFDKFKSLVTFDYLETKNESDFEVAIKENLEFLSKDDIFAAPFIRYRKIWTLVSVARRKEVVTVQLSESLPDSFGLFGYRIGFLWAKSSILKNIIGIPIMYLYALINKPDICFYNLAPQVLNPFVKKTVQAVIPSLSKDKYEMLRNLLGNIRRPLIVAGFDYDKKAIVSYYNLKSYIATSKDLEIDIDGRIYPLKEFVCAEEVLMGGFVSKVIGYNSTAICWAYRMGVKDIDCYESQKLNRLCGRYGYHSRKTLKKCGITLHPSNKSLMA